MTFNYKSTTILGGLIVTAISVSVNSCSQSQFGSGGSTPSHPAPSPAPAPTAAPAVETPNPAPVPAANQNPAPSAATPLSVDSGNLLALVSSPSSTIQYQANACPNGGACGDQSQQTAVDGLDFRNITATASLTPQSAIPAIQQNVGRTVVSGLGAGSNWGWRSYVFSYANVPIYNVNDVVVMQQCSPDRVPIGAQKVAQTSQVDSSYLCAKLDPRLQVGTPVSQPASMKWDYNAVTTCPKDNIALGINPADPNTRAWSILCAPISVKP